MTLPSRPLAGLPPGKLTLGVPALCCACRECNYSLSAHLTPAMEELALGDIPSLLAALPEGIKQSFMVFGQPHQQAGHDVSLGLIYLVPMVTLGAAPPPPSPEEAAG